ncbi:MAG: FkbM family methyltransferase [Brumimicrobium sp.]
MNVKETLRRILIALRLDLTKNLEYDRLTKAILKKTLKETFNCIDVGCHKGEILDIILEYAPKGKHLAFEPIPSLYENLKKKYTKNVTVYPYALSNISGKTTFNFVKNAPAYSGIRKRKYDVKNPDIKEIEVEVKKMDEIVAINQRIDFIKIDVEGGEYGVLVGARNTLLRNYPVILFESGKGASEFYGKTPDELHQYLVGEIGYKIYTLKSFIGDKESISESEFVNYFNTNKEYGFVASK